MSETITVERVDIKQTTIEVHASTPQEAFALVKSGEGDEIGTVKKSELVIREYPDESTAPAA